MSLALVDQLANHFQLSQRFYFLVTDMQGHLVFVNKLFEGRASGKDSSLLSTDLRDLLNRPSIEAYHELVRQCAQLKSPRLSSILEFNFPTGSAMRASWEVTRIGEQQADQFILWTGTEILDETELIAAQLRQSESFYHNVIANSVDGVLMADLNGQITYCAPSVMKIVGYPDESLLGHNIFEFVHPEDIASAKQVFDLEVKKENQLRYIFLRLMHSDGEWKWYSVRGYNLFETPGINAMVIYFTEETKRKVVEDKLEESERRFHNLINNLRLGVLVQNEKTEILVCNKASMQLLGLTEDQLLGKTSFDPAWLVIREDGTEFPVPSRPVSVAIRTKLPVTDVVMGVFRPTKNDMVWLLVNCDPILTIEGDITHVITSFTDITEQRRLSQQLVEMEVQKQKQLVQATIDGQEKERREIGRELHDNISQHLTTTRLYLEAARDHASGEALQLIQMAHSGLLNTVKEIRNLSQSLVPPSLSDIGLVEAIDDLCTPLMTIHSFTIRFRHHPFDESLLPDNMKLMLFRIVQEQINNIVRHAQAGKVTLALQTRPTQVLLSISDDGKGFDPHTVKKGLGLDNIVSRADLFGGKLQIESSPGNGCSIHVSIPLAPARV